MERSSKRRRFNKRSSKEEKAALQKTTILDLPCVLLIDIFSRLPPNTILRFNRACQSWSWSWHNHLFLDPDFANQISHIKSLSESFILRSNKHGKLCLFDPCEISSTSRDRVPSNVSISFKSDFGIPTIGDFELVNSCNGFLCLCDSKTRYPTYILNPEIGEYIKLPLSVPKNEETDNCYIVSRLGFSPVTNKYKVVRFYSNYSRLKFRVEIHTVGTGTWRKIEGRVLNSFCDRSHYDVFLHGSLHWVVTRYSSASDLIMSFNFDNETFRSIQPPYYQPPYYVERYGGRRGRMGKDFVTSLGVIDGCLGVCVPDQSDLEIWVTEDCCNYYSWVKKFVIKNIPSRFRPFRPLSLLNNGKFFVCYDGKALVSYEPVAQEVRDDLSIFDNGNFKKIEIHGIKNFQLVVHTPSFASFKDIALGENLKIFRVDLRDKNKHTLNAKSGTNDVSYTYRLATTPFITRPVTRGAVG